MKKYSHKSIFKSISAAHRGMMLAAKSQKNFRIEVLIAVAVFLTAVLLKFTFVELAVVAVVIGFVLFAELTNTAIEFITDTYFRTKYSEIAKMTKDSDPLTYELMLHIMEEEENHEQKFEDLRDWLKEI